MQQLKLAFGCQARVGKSTAVELLKKQYGGTEISFAEPLYDILRFTQKRCNLPQEKDRKFLQIIGTEWGRNKNPNLWINLLKDKLEELQYEKFIYVSDMRFTNEFEKLKELGFITIRIIRQKSSSDETFGSGSKTHASETELLSVKDEDWDYIVSNDGTKHEFKERIFEIVESLIFKKQSSEFILGC